MYHIFSACTVSTKNKIRWFDISVYDISAVHILDSLKLKGLMKIR